nr:LOW QUALITY PROTEIN: uncharacterized protein LOC119177824 [Rhipicephalus microplus]
MPTNRTLCHNRPRVSPWIDARTFVQMHRLAVFRMAPIVAFHGVALMLPLMLPVTRAVLMDFATFNAKVVPSCFNESSMRTESATAHTLDAFTSLVRKVEAAHPALDVADTAAMLLARFSIDFVDHQRLANGGERFVVDSARELKAAVLEAMLGNAQLLQPFDEGSLSDGEKCALFYMLSHTFNSGPQPQDENRLLKKFIYSGYMNRPLKVYERKRRETPRLRSVQEQGVVGVAHNATMSIALGHVLKGLVASKYAQRDTVQNVMQTLKPYGHLDQGHVVVDHVYGPTVAVHLGTVSTWSNSKLPTIGGGGLWTTPACPREFRVADKTARLTDAEIVGTVDGFMLAMTLRRMNKQRPRRLSQILDGYYSVRGIRELLPEFPDGLSFCTRKQAVSRLLSAPRLEEQVVLVARMYSRLINDAPLKRSALKNSLLPALKSFHSRLDHLLKPPRECIEGNDDNLVTCDTQTDVLVLLDPIPGNSIYENYQKKIASYMAERLLKTGSQHTAVSLSPAALSEDASELELAYNSRQDTDASPSCAIENMAGKGCSQCTEVDIWRAVHKTWDKAQTTRTASYPLSPSKVVVYFKFSSFRESLEDVHSVVQHLREKHEDLKIFTVGPRTDILRAFKHGPRDSVVVIPNSMDDVLLRRIARELTEEVCRAPMAILCHECQRSSVGRASDTVEDFQAPLTVRHWAVYPGQFNDVPRVVNITFESFHLPIKVCLVRFDSNGTKVATYSELCQETGSKVKAIRYSVRKVCASEESSSCHSLQFSVTALPRKAGDPFLECADPGCQLPDQTKILITYEIDFHSGQDKLFSGIEERINIPLPSPDTPQLLQRALSAKCSKYIQLNGTNHSENGHYFALSLSFFVELVRKIEAAYPQRNLFDIAALLLNCVLKPRLKKSSQRVTMTFADGNKIGRDLSEQMTLESWLSPWPRGLGEQPMTFNKTILTESEMCALFLMLHHSFHENRDNDSVYTIEKGVAQVSWESPKIAVAVAKVLQGIMVGMIHKAGNLTDVWQADEPAKDPRVPPVDPLLSATIGVVLAVSSVESLLHHHGGSVIGYEGVWFGESCPGAYRTGGKRHWCSYSVLRGAIDGLLLGKYSRLVSSRGMPLSRLLSMYYGVWGVPRAVPGVPGLSVCGRRELLYPYLRDGLLEGNVSHMARAYLLHRYGQTSKRLSLFVAAATGEFLQRLRRDLLRHPAFCDRYPPTPDQAECRTPGDVFIVMDADAYANDLWMKQQKRTVELLAQRLNIGSHSGRFMHLYVNKRDIDGTLQLQMANETSSSTVSCYARSTNFSEIATDNEVVVLESLRNLLSNNLNRNRGPIAPATIIVIFKFGHLRSLHQRLKPLLPRVLGSAGSIIAVGNNITSLQQMVRREGRGVMKGHDKVMLLAATEDAAKDVANKIVDEACTAPALLRCLNDGVESKDKFSFQGSVTENGVIYLMLDPEDYNNFEDLNIKIEAVGGTLKVCQRRTKFHHLQLQDCDTVSENGDPCSPLYLAIVGISEECSYISIFKRQQQRYPILKPLL